MSSFAILTVQMKNNDQTLPSNNDNSAGPEADSAPKTLPLAPLGEIVRLTRNLQIRFGPLVAICAELLAAGTLPSELPLKGRQRIQARILAQLLVASRSVNELAKHGYRARKNNPTRRAICRNFAHIRLRMSAKMALGKQMIIKLCPELEPEFEKVAATSKAEAAQLKSLTIGTDRKKRDSIAETDRQFRALERRLRIGGQKEVAEKEKALHEEYLERRKSGDNPHSDSDSQPESTSAMQRWEAT